MLNEPSDSPKKNTSESPSPAWKPNRGTYNVPSRNTAPPQAPPGQQPRPASTVRRPGCVTLTAGVFFLISLFNLLGLLQNLLVFDVALLFVNLIQIVLVLAIVYGLMEMVRWGANLVIIWCAGTILQLLLQAILMSILIGDYLATAFLETFYIIIILAMSIVFSVILGFIMRWFIRVRKWFLPGDLAEAIEHRIYLIAIGIVILSTIASLVVIPEVLDSQQPLFDDLNRQIESSQ